MRSTESNTEALHNLFTHNSTLPLQHRMPHCSLSLALHLAVAAPARPAQPKLGESRTTSPSGTRATLSAVDRCRPATKRYVG